MDIIGIDQINSEEFYAIDLRDEARGALGDGHDVECYRVKLKGAAQPVEVLHSSGGVTGISWDGSIEWLDQRYSGRNGAKEAVLDFFEGQS